jgi:hypothetical protein
MSSAINDLKSAPQTFSSWSACMSKSYCKWPAIIGIIMAVLMAVSIIWCCVRCCCCGLDCCCGICSCFNRCCPSGRGRRNRDRDRDRYGDSQEGFRHGGQPNPYMGYIPPSGPPVYQGPNTATFSVPGKKGDPDALPAMPTWSDAQPVHDDVEMGNMPPNGQATGVVPTSGRISKGGYHELPNHDDAMAQQPGNYRGADSTHPYGSDLGAQGMFAQNTAYDPPAKTDRFQPGAAAPNPYLRSSPPQGYAAYSPDGGYGQEPPSALQVGRRPVNGSTREL